MQKGLAFEEIRQEQELLSGGEILQETRRWDDSKKETILMRIKEGSDDYRYFPEPDLVTLLIDQDWIDKIKARFQSCRMREKSAILKNMTCRLMMQE